MDMWFLNVFEACGNRCGRGTYVFFDIMKRGPEMAYILVCEYLFLDTWRRYNRTEYVWI